jgi:glycosyltransferase involved in cell wall biosynthesis
MTSQISRELISIIVVSLNTKKKFLKTIKSVQKQVYKNYEIIIVDGKSVDGTVDEIKKLKDKKVKYIIQKDKGIYDAMNKGIRKSSGKWIIFLNSGDIFNSQNILQNIFTKKITHYDVIYSDTIVVTKNLSYKVKGKNFTKKTVIMPFCHQSTIVKSQHLKNNQFDLNYKLSSDFNFFLNSYYKKFKFYRYSQIISKVEAKGKSDLNRQKVFSENIEIFLKKGFYFKVLQLFGLKFFDLIKNLIKVLLPATLIKKILVIKYQKSF